MSNTFIKVILVLYSARWHCRTDKNIRWIVRVVKITPFTLLYTHDEFKMYIYKGHAIFPLYIIIMHTGYVRLQNTIIGFFYIIRPFFFVCVYVWHCRHLSLCVCVRCQRGCNVWEWFLSSSIFSIQLTRYLLL